MAWYSYSTIPQAVVSNIKTPPLVQLNTGGSENIPGSAPYNPRMHSNKELVVEPIGLDVETLRKPVHWKELFGNDHPIELEIGIG